jgi:hypothetical protein
MKTNTFGIVLLTIGVTLSMSAWMLHDRGEIALPDSPPKNQNTIVITQTGTNSGAIQVVHSSVTDFHMPNLEWKSRDVTLTDGRTLHYTFGEGNPKEVALDQEGLEKLAVQCENDHSGTLAIAGICDAESGRPFYVSPDVEKYLSMALSDPEWQKIATECANNFRVIETPDTLANAELDKNFLYFDRVFTPGFLDLDNFISIDKNTGRKTMEYARAYYLSIFLESGTYEGYRNATDWRNPYGKCVNKYAKEITRNLLVAVTLYRNHMDVSITDLQQTGSLLSPTWEFPWF